MRLPSGFAMAGLFILGCLTGCQQSTTRNAPLTGVLRTVVVPTVTNPAASPSVPTRTATPSQTSTPDETETPEPTLEIPTATPLGPTPQAGVRYRLAPWSADAANALIETLRAYPDGLEYFDRGYHDSGYYSASIYAAEAQAQALLRFPQSRWTDSWTWDQAYRWALVGGPVGVDLYRQLIGAALKTGETDLAQLPDWFAAHEPVGYLRLELIPPPKTADPTPGSLIAITDGGSAGFLWIADEPNGARVYPLHSSSDFGFSSADSAGAEWRDVTGDGRPEILTSHVFMPGSLDALTTYFDVFDVSGGAPMRLPFDPELPHSHSRTLTVMDVGGPNLEFRFVFDSFSCPFTYTQTYRWSGQGFTLTATEYPDAAGVQANSDELCADILLNALIYDLHDGNLDVRPALQDLLSAWPYSTQLWPPNNDGSADVRDRARFLVGLDLALLDRPVEARAQIDSIVSTPVIPESRWIAPGRAFLAVYQGPATLAEACIRSGVCADLLQPVDLAQMAARSGQPPAEILAALGLTIVSHGSVDLTGDGQPEEWAAVNWGDSGTTLFGFLGTEPTVAVVLASTSSEIPRDVHVDTTESGDPLLVYDTNDGFVYQTLGWSDGVLRLTAACTTLRQRVQSGYESLLDGGSAQAVLADMRSFESVLDERCRSPWDQRPYLIPQWLYVTALSAEWAQQPEVAASLYLQLWQEYPNSAYALMARARLEPDP